MGTLGCRSSLPRPCTFPDTSLSYQSLTSIVKHFLGTFEDWLYKHVAGIKSTGIAFQSVTVSPLVTAYLQTASAWTLTPFGNFSVSWRNASGSLIVDLQVPVSVNATLILPPGLQKVEEKGSLLSSNSDYKVVTSDNSTSVVMGSGNFSFVATAH